MVSASCKNEPLSEGLQYFFKGTPQQLKSFEPLLIWCHSGTAWKAFGELVMH